MNSIRNEAEQTRPQTSEILVIEDDVLQAHEIEVHLGRLGFSVATLGGGSDSLHQIANIDPRVVIIDYNLPDIDGLTVAGRVRRLAPNAAVILMSGRIDFVPADMLDNRGMVAFFKKPIDLVRLRRLVSKLVRDPRLTRRELDSPIARLFSPGR